MRQQSDNNDRKLLKGTSGARNSGVPAISVLKPGKHVLVPITQSFHRTQYVVHCSCSSTSRSTFTSQVEISKLHLIPPEWLGLVILIFFIILFFLDISRTFLPVKNVFKFDIPAEEYTINLVNPICQFIPIFDHVYIS